MLVEPQQRLTRAVEFGDFGEHQSDRFLHAPIRIRLQTAASLHEADRCGDDQLASARLLVERRQ